MNPLYIHSREPDGAGRYTPEPQSLTLGSLFDGFGDCLISGIVYYSQFPEFLL
ncbi:hypothetical protein K420107F6_13720 [Lactonifactor longoviformis]